MILNSKPFCQLTLKNSAEFDEMGPIYGHFQTLGSGILKTPGQIHFLEFDILKGSLEWF